MWRPDLLRRAATVHQDIGQIADIAGDPRWWLLATAAAVRWPARNGYLASDGEPAGDTFIGFPSAPLDAHALADAARQAIRALDGTLPGQPLAVTLERDILGARTVPSDLSTVAFIDGGRVRIEGDSVPFVAISVDDEPIETARHGHRQAWRNGRGPWLGIGRAGGLTIVSTCHMVVDGYGHAQLAAAILARAIAGQAVGGPAKRLSTDRVDAADDPVRQVAPGSIPLAVHWRELAGHAPRLLDLAYRLGIALHRLAGDPAATFSPTFQIPVAPGAPDDPDRLKRRVIPAIVSVRFSDGRPEPFEVFAARAKEILAREAAGDGLTTRLFTAAQSIPVPTRWKRSQLGAERGGWWGNVAEVLGGRVCLTKLRMDVPAVAVSSAAQLASERDPLGGSVITVVDAGDRAIVTICGTGLAAEAALLDEILSAGR
jgi:hypothetical protein